MDIVDTAGPGRDGEDAEDANELLLLLQLQRNAEHFDHEMEAGCEASPKC